MTSFYDIITRRTRRERDLFELNTCTLCERTLTPTDAFVIAKAYQRGQCILEAAQCFECQMESRDYVSEQSMENIMLYSGRRFKSFIMDSEHRERYHLDDPSCLITGENLGLHDDFELYHFNIPGSGLSSEENFLFVGPTAIEQMSELLSEETRKSWEGFLESISPETPEIHISPMFM